MHTNQEIFYAHNLFIFKNPPEQMVCFANESAEQPRLRSSRGAPRSGLFRPNENCRRRASNPCQKKFTRIIFSFSKTHLKEWFILTTSLQSSRACEAAEELRAAGVSSSAQMKIVQSFILKLNNHTAKRPYHPYQVAYLSLPNFSTWHCYYKSPI